MINLEIVHNQNRSSTEIKRIADLFVSSEGDGHRYLFGRNEHSAALAEIFNIEGYVDDFVQQGIIWTDKPVFSSNDIPHNSIIINCVMASLPISAQKRIYELQVTKVISYYDLQILLPDIVPLPKFVEETQLDFALNKKKWEMINESLFDAESKEVLEKLLHYRLTGDWSFMKQFTYRPKDQYFEDFLEFQADEVFIDAGGFDGDTTELFCMKNPHYKRVFLFEPDAINLENAKKRLKDYRSIEFIELGVSDSIDTLWFNPNNGSASSIGESGSCKIDVTTIDHHIDTKVTFIKMDLEGWELKALAGAKNHILDDHPKLAIAVYHQPSDFWRVFEFVFSLRQDYKIFLRHYTEGWTETIMYFVPK